MTDFREAGRRYGVVECALPGWDEETDFVLKLRRPGLVSMVNAAGFIPNPLLAAVEEMFFPVGNAARLPSDQQAKALYAIARYAMVEPTMDELTDAGLELTDEQYLAIYAFALKGASGLARFRQELRGKSIGDGTDVSGEAIGDGRNSRPV